MKYKLSPNLRASFEFEAKALADFINYNTNSTAEERSSARDRLCDVQHKLGAMGVDAASTVSEDSEEVDAL